MRLTLLEAAARLLSEDGPTALTTRRVASEAGTSTMAVYTHFGSINDLVQAVVVEGFRRFGERLRAVPRTDDPLADLVGLSVAYRENALENRHLYTVMFGSASLGGYRRTSPDQLQIGRDTFDQFSEVLQRAMDGGLIEKAHPVTLTAEVWAALHGALLLEIAGFFSGPTAPVVVTRLLAATIKGFGAADIDTSRLLGAPAPAKKRSVKRKPAAPRRAATQA